MRTSPVTPDETDLRAIYDADENTIAIVSNVDGTDIIELPVTTKASGSAFFMGIERQLRDIGLERRGEWRTPGYEPGQIGAEDGPETVECYVADVNPLALLHAVYVELREDGASSSDVEQMLDDYLVARGHKTVLYA